MSDSRDIALHTDNCAKETGYLPNGGSRKYECNAPKVARYVSIINGKPDGYAHFALCEVVVIGTEAQGM